jgi:hypothetical protein
VVDETMMRNRERIAIESSYSRAVDHELRPSACTTSALLTLCISLILPNSVAVRLFFLCAVRNETTYRRTSVHTPPAQPGSLPGSHEACHLSLCTNEVSQAADTDKTLFGSAYQSILPTGPRLMYLYSTSCPVMYGHLECNIPSYALSGQPLPRTASNQTGLLALWYNEISVWVGFPDRCAVPLESDEFVADCHSSVEFGGSCPSLRLIGSWARAESQLHR